MEEEEEEEEEEESHTGTVLFYPDILLVVLYCCVIRLQRIYNFFIVPSYYIINLGCSIYNYKQRYIIFWD